MLGQSKFKKDIGFIRHRSSRVIKKTLQQSSSSNDFSSFDCDKQSEREFSPYRQPTVLRQTKSKKQINNPPNIPKYQQKNLKKQSSAANLKDVQNTQFTNQFLKDRFNYKSNSNEAQMQNIRSKVKNIASNIDTLSFKYPNKQKRQAIVKSQQQQPLQNIMQEYSLGKPQIDNFGQISKIPQQIYRRHASNQNLVHVVQKKISFQNLKNAEGNRNLQNSESSEQFEDIFESQNPKKSQNYLHYKELQKRKQYEQQEDLITEYDVCQFAKKKTIKDQIKGYSPNRQKLKTQQGNYYSTRGGICFQLDVKDFATENKDNNEQKPQTKYQEQQIEKPFKKTGYQPYKLVKKKQVNTKQQILKRRQLARNYDQIARKKVFGGY